MVSAELLVGLNVLFFVFVFYHDYFPKFMMLFSLYRRRKEALKKVKIENAREYLRISGLWEICFYPVFLFLVFHYFAILAFGFWFFLISFLYPIAIIWITSRIPLNQIEKVEKIHWGGYGPLAVISLKNRWLGRILFISRRVWGILVIVGFILMFLSIGLQG